MEHISTWIYSIFIKLWANFYQKKVDTDNKNIILLPRETKTRMFLWLLHIATFEVVQIFDLFDFANFQLEWNVQITFFGLMCSFSQILRNKGMNGRLLPCHIKYKTRKIKRSTNSFIIFINHVGSSYYCFWDLKISYWLRDLANTSMPIHYRRAWTRSWIVKNDFFF